MLFCTRSIHSRSIIVQNEGDMKEMKLTFPRSTHNSVSLRDKLEILSPSVESHCQHSNAYTIVELSFEMTKIAKECILTNR